MIDPFQIATQGIGPGWTTFNMATMGFGFEIEIIIQPVQGGGGGAAIWTPAEEYEIIVRIKYKGRVWEQRRFITALAARSLEKVLSSFRRMSVKTVGVVATINNVVKQKIQIFVNFLNR